MSPPKYQLKLLLEEVHIGHQPLGIDGLEAKRRKNLKLQAQTLMKEIFLNTLN